MNNENVTSTKDAGVFNFPIISGSEFNIQIYKCLDMLSNSVGEVITEYHWREFCGLMRQMVGSVNQSWKQ